MVVPALDLPAVIGHRGAAASSPENTLASFRRAAALGASWVEFDVRLAGDGTCILLHDDTVDRTTDGRGRADAMSFAELRRLDAGSWFGPAFAGERIPGLEEAIEALEELGLGANIEIKPGPGAAAATGEAVARLVASRWPSSLPPPLFSSFRREALAAARRVAPDIARGLLVGAIPAGWRRAVEALGCVALHCDDRKLLPSQAGECRKAGWPVLVYTVNDAPRADELRRWGVAAIISDCPDAVAPGAVPRSTSALRALI